MAQIGIVLRKTNHRQILSIDEEQLTQYLRQIPPDSKGRKLFEITENPNTEQHTRISHFLKPLRITKVEGPEYFKPEYPTSYK